MTVNDEPVDFEFVMPSPEMLEAQARLLAPLNVPPLPDDAPRQTTAFGVSLRLPPELERVAAEDSDHAVWQGGHAYSLTVLVHEGVGQFVYEFESGDNAPAPLDEGVFQISLAGRAAEIVLTRYVSAEHEVYFAAASTPVTPDRMVAVLIVAPSAGLRARLIATIPTVRTEG
jgi:hypothetical protein